MFLAFALIALLLLGLAFLSLGFIIFAGFFQDCVVRWVGHSAQRRRLWGWRSRFIRLCWISLILLGHRVVPNLRLLSTSEISMDNLHEIDWSLGHLPKNLNDVVLIHSDPAGDVVVWNFLLNSFYLMMFRLLAGLRGFTTTKARRCLKIVLLLELELALRHDNHVELYFKMMILQTLKFHTIHTFILHSLKSHTLKVPSSHILSRFSQGTLSRFSQGTFSRFSQGTLSRFPQVTLSSCPDRTNFL